MKDLSNYRNKIIQGNALDVAKQLPSKIVQVCITSPPYWGLRDYGTGNWIGGDDKCSHSKSTSDKISASTLGGKSNNNNHEKEGWPGGVCGKWGALKNDEQIGLEDTIEEYIEKLVLLFREIRRILRDDGTLWLNMGDSYSGSGRAASGGGRGDKSKLQSSNTGSLTVVKRGIVGNLKNKNLCGIPWRLALALQADGWFLRSDIIWAKPDPMPESVLDRPCRSHEYLFLLTKKEKYYYDNIAVLMPIANSTIKRGPVDFGGEKGRNYKPEKGDPNFRNGSEQWGRTYNYNHNGRNLRTVWNIATQGYKQAHFATFPEKLIEPCILAGSSETTCGVCGAPWERIIEKPKYGDWNNRKGTPAELEKGNTGKPIPEDYYLKTIGFKPTCKHNDDSGRGIIYDPFMGAGTVAKVALRSGPGRNFIGSELNPHYIDLALRRIKSLMDQITLL